MTDPYYLVFLGLGLFIGFVLGWLVCSDYYIRKFGLRVGP